MAGDVIRPVESEPFVKRRVLQPSGLNLTEVCFGGASLGNLYHAVDDEAAAAAVDAAWDVGIRFYDTAPHYGLGLSERRMGQALRDRPRGDYVLSTKVGRLLVPNDAAPGELDDHGFAVPATFRRQWDFSADGVRRSIEESLVRLGLDRIDIVYLHDPDDHWEQAVSQAYPALAELRSQGVVRAIGAGMNQSAMLEAFVRETDMDVIMLAGRYTLLDQEALDRLLPLCVERSVGVVNVGVFNSGLLAVPDPKPGLNYNYSTAPDELVQRAIRIAAVCRQYGVTLPTVAIQFGSAHPAVVSTGIGTNSATRVLENVEMYERPVPAELWAELKRLGLLPEAAPVPVD
jgi:D-threo-aldose 1-dehydrogenase